MKYLNRPGPAIAFAVSVMLGACSSTPIAPVGTATTSPPPPTQPPSDPSKTGVPTAVVSKPISPYLDPRSPLHKQRSVHFDFDQYSVKPEYAALLEMHGKYLAANSNVSIRVQGNTDEQGGAEYNLALGQKRADAVAHALKVYGVKDTQLEAVSFGKEKPMAMGHDDAARAQNRRADLAYPER